MFVLSDPQCSYIYFCITFLTHVLGSALQSLIIIIIIMHSKPEPNTSKLHISVIYLVFAVSLAPTRQTTKLMTLVRVLMQLWYIISHGLKECNVHLHADNCVLHKIKTMQTFITYSGKL